MKELHKFYSSNEIPNDYYNRNFNYLNEVKNIDLVNAMKSVFSVLFVFLSIAILSFIFEFIFHYL